MNPWSRQTHGKSPPPGEVSRESYKEAWILNFPEVCRERKQPSWYLHHIGCQMGIQKTLIPVSSLQDSEEVLKQTQNLNMYCHFANGIGEPKYMPVQSWDLLNQTLVEALESHNEVNAVMDLVLFEDAIRHM